MVRAAGQSQSHTSSRALPPLLVDCTRGNQIVEAYVGRPYTVTSMIDDQLTTESGSLDRGAR